MCSQNILETGKRIIETEISGLKDLKQSLNEEFVKVCNLLLDVKGRIILSGMGKSGHIANKIASTLASTGSPAIFVHPAESTHGDLGMITKDDVVIAISNSGNTIELLGIINYCIRFKIPLIAITSNMEGELAKASTHCLLLPKSKEACSLGLAPTTSTTNTLALGDALAITLLELKGFSPDDFKIFHPGGALGTKLLKVAKIMHQGDELPVILEGKKMSEALLIITSHKFGCTGVINKQGDLIGIVTDGDIRRSMDNNFLNKSVNEVMNKNVIYVNGTTNASQAIITMNEHKITSLFIVENKKPIGILHIHDLVKVGVV